MSNRRRLVESIEKKGNCVLLCMATSERANVPAQLDESYVVTAHRLLRGVSLKDDQALGLLIYSRGGLGQVPLELVAMIREMFPKRRIMVFVPYRAYSAATVIALGGDEIVMGPRGHLGPIDATIHQYPHSPKDQQGNPLPVGVEEVRKYFDLIRDMIGKPSGSAELDLAALEALTNSVCPLALGAVQRTLKATEHDARVLLRTRLAPKSDEENEKIVQSVASEITYHGHAIFRTEARSLGIDFVKDAEEYGVQDELWELVEAYMDLLQVHRPFEVDLRVEIDGESHAEEKGVRLGLMETQADSRICLVDYFCRRALQPMPQIQLTANLEAAQNIVAELVQGVHNGVKGLAASGMAPAPGQIEAMIVGILQQGIQEWLKNEGQRAVQEALAKAMPSGIMRWLRNQRWEKLDS